MGKYGTLAKRLLDGKDVTLYYKKYNDGTDENPDILINRVHACIEKSSRGFEDIIVYLSKENDEIIFDSYEIYRMPVIKDVKILAPILKMANEQVHCEF